ncbi:MAG TPA: NHL repeat-containing protein, partial [Candidatus Ozemobacteraceae bacterium]|nr:NHL repeat-containing protein [Candidatus Ozemobacteraceae bacterium]
FISPSDMGIAGNGDIIVADSGNNRIQVLAGNDLSCKFSFGEFGSGGNKFLGISGLAVNRLSGEIAVCDLKGHKISKFDSTGKQILYFTDKVRCPLDIEFDKLGNMYVIMTKQPGIYKYNQRGVFQEIVGGKGKAAFVFATSITFANDHLYIADYGAKRIVKMTLSGEVVREVTQKGEYEELQGPRGVGVDDKENYYILDLGEVPISMLTKEGALISRIGVFGKEPGQFLYPRTILARNEGDVLILDYTRNVILNFKKMATK